MRTLWVQSKYSKESRKFEVTEGDPYYHYWQPPDRGFVLPKEEYIPCDPPERWEVCTRSMAKLGDSVLAIRDRAMMLPDGAIWRWSEKDPDAIVIKRKVP